MELHTNNKVSSPYFKKRKLYGVGNKIVADKIESKLYSVLDVDGSTLSLQIDVNKAVYAFTSYNAAEKYLRHMMRDADDKPLVIIQCKLSIYDVVGVGDNSEIAAKQLSVNYIYAPNLSP
jgi:hypothetical protein